jgi:hypothetical protein
MSFSTSLFSSITDDSDHKGMGDQSKKRCTVFLNGLYESRIGMPCVRLSAFGHHVSEPNLNVLLQITNVYRNVP